MRPRPTSQGNFFGEWNAWYVSVSLILLTVAAFLPALRAGFIWDDDTILTNNPLIKAGNGLSKFWFSREAIDYWPVTYSSFWIEWRVWGLHPLGYHAVNVALHALSAVLLMILLNDLRIPGGGFAAALFAVHPVNVESVAWIAERKNTLSLLLLLVSAIAYFRSEQAGKKIPWYFASLAAFTLAMLAKGSVALTPVTISILIIWRRNFTRRDATRLLPFFLISVVLVWVNIWFQTHGSGEAIRSVTPLERILGAGAVVWFYLSKALFPANLCFVYPQWMIDTSRATWWIPLIGMVATTFVLFCYRKFWSAPYLVAWLTFGAALVPVMGLKDVYFMKYSLVADHYQYIALISIVTIAASGWYKWKLRQPITATITGFCVVGLLASETVKLGGWYKDSYSLFHATVQRNPRAWMAQNNLGADLVASGQSSAALPYLEDALLLRPNYVEAHINLGNAEFALGKLSDAKAHYETAVRLDGNAFEAFNGLGNIYMQEGRPSDALTEYLHVLKQKPHAFQFHQNVANAYRLLGWYPQAISEFTLALDLNPANAQAGLDLGRTFLATGNSDDAIKCFRNSLAIQPTSWETHNALANALNTVGKTTEAIQEYEVALQLKEDYVDAHYNLALTLLRLGNVIEGRRHYAEALRLNPNLPRRAELE